MRGAKAMDSCSAVVRDVVAALEGPGSVRGFAVRGAFAKERHETPLAGDVVTVSLGDVAGRSGAFHDLIGQPTEQDGDTRRYYGKLFDVTLRLRILTPAHSGGARCTQVLGAVVDALMLGELTDVNIGAVRTHELAYDRELRAFVLPLELETRVYMLRTRESDVFDDVVVSRVS